LGSEAVEKMSLINFQNGTSTFLYRQFSSFTITSIYFPCRWSWINTIRKFKIKSLIILYKSRSMDIISFIFYYFIILKV
jgi:hypothetical protein